MSEEEWLFWVIVIGGSILAGAVFIIDLFSLQKFWARLMRSRTPPTPERIAKAYTRHQRFFHKTDQRLFSTTYVSFYLFVLSFWGILLLNAFILVQDILKGLDYNADQRLLRLIYILFFFLVARWYYRQEHHYTTAHKLVAILSCIILIDFVHLLTGADYVQVTSILLICWVWMIGILRAVLTYEVNYARDVAFSTGIPVAIVYYLIKPDAFVVLLIMAPVFILVLREFVTKSDKYDKIEQFFDPLPFKPVQPDSFLKDVLYSLSPRETFAGCSALEVLFWFFMTPVVLIPVTLYLQGREEQLQQWHKTILTWSQNEYVLHPETVADRLGLTLEDTYPLLNELTEEGRLTLYESTEGLLYGLPPSEEIEAFKTRLNLQRAELPEKYKDLLEYLWEKSRTRPPTTLLLSIIENGQKLEVSCEPAGGTISALKSSAVMKKNVHLEQVARDITYFVGETVHMLAHLKQYTLVNPDTFLQTLQKKGRTLLEFSVPPEITEGFEMSHIVLETNMDAPFELMFSDQFFALKYAIGRRLRVTGPVSVSVRSHRDAGKLRALIIADPVCDLPEALTECTFLERELSTLIETHFLIQKNATLKQVSHCLIEGYSIIHYAGHVSENGLRLSDSVLTPSTIETLLWGNPIVFINGCNSASTHTDLAEAFLKSGALGYIGSVWEIHDTAAAELAVHFYKNSFQHTVGEALRRAKASTFSENNIAWLCFILFGDPTLRLI